MERYYYFASSSGQFGLHGKSLSERMVDESETDGALSTILKILRRVHHEFFLNMVSAILYLYFKQVIISPNLLTKLDCVRMLVLILKIKM